MCHQICSQCPNNIKETRPQSSNGFPIWKAPINCCLETLLLVHDNCLQQNIPPYQTLSLVVSSSIKDTFKDTWRGKSQNGKLQTTKNKLKIKTWSPSTYLPIYLPTYLHLSTSIYIYLPTYLPTYLSPNQPPTTPTSFPGHFDRPWSSRDPGPRSAASAARRRRVSAGGPSAAPRCARWARCAERPSAAWAPSSAASTRRRGEAGELGSCGGDLGWDGVPSGYD